MNARHRSALDGFTLEAVQRVGSVLAALLALCVATACAPGGTTTSESKERARSEPVAKSALPLAGVDGARTIGSADTVVNQYTPLAGDVTAGATSLTVTDVAALDPGSDPLAPGDLLLVIQMQGATLDTAAADATWGQVSDLGSAGLYELVEVTAVDAGSDTVSLSCALANDYVASGNVQVVRVPQYTDLTIEAGASLTAPAWDGSTGGIVAVHAENTVTLDGSIDVSALGFRGGPADNFSASADDDTTLYAGPGPASGGRKGEGIGGFLSSYGRGAAANGGGGGNAHNAGGGGGANGRNGLLWTGQGVFDLSVVGGASAWLLDPSYSATASAG
ncbi:MAG TPA: hypothetical protein VKZ49_04145, partial [Polyangiaceae bacterium]|nr:hypothetical protein [Polyangiaceae bacterium]